MFTMYYSSLIQELLPLQVEKRFISGFCFLYIQSELPADQLERLINTFAAHICHNKKITYECSPVRSITGGHIFRMRFLPPSGKMFCCGNECTDCVREIRKK
ncbi:hypothetical protein [Alkalicoccobacillus gibsonii]|uniref:hypothetical protein n=1 Tax=Alkalicoccobacillus gibsonii TaxID=79881 RepID=UPI0019330EC8|nr:hypothetical protein [Alkalicoccobacillus gibsonii]MBM0065280.1 hypothetical protein [Alkalicoccobacillus gibsonii]